MDSRHVGTELRGARERRGLTLRQVAASTRIPVSALEALEAGLVSKLPGGIFSRAFVRAYAVEVGLDPEEAVRDFVEQFRVDAVTYGSPLVQDTHAEGASLDAEFRPWPGLMVLGAVAAAGLIATTLVVLWWRGSVAASASEETPRPFAASAAEPTPPPAAPLRSSASGATAPPAPSPASAATTPAAGVRLTIAPEGPCWVRVTADGREVFSGLLDKGASETHDAKQTLVLTVGDAAACRVTLNGRPARTLGRPGQVVTVRVTPADVQTFWP